VWLLYASTLPAGVSHADIQLLLLLLLICCALQVDTQRIRNASDTLYLLDTVTDPTISRSISSSSAGSSSSSSSAVMHSLQSMLTTRGPFMLTLLEMTLFPDGLPLMEGVNNIRGAFDDSLMAQAGALQIAQADADAATAALLTAESHPSSPVRFAAASAGACGAVHAPK
jgi:hypothetical protein